MTEFSELFSKWVNEKEIKVSALAQFCGLDRPTVYKYLNGQRLPATKELAERIGEFLRLSPAQRQEFLEIYQITKMGKSTYQNRKNVRKFLRGDWNEQKDDAKAPRNAGQNPALDAQTAAVSGRRLAPCFWKKAGKKGRWRFSSISPGLNFCAVFSPPGRRCLPIPAWNISSV